MASESQQEGHRRRFVGFVEGARKGQGGVGLTGVPGIHQALVRRGHDDILIMGSPRIPSSSRMMTASAATAFTHVGLQTPQVISYKGLTRWQFSPVLFAQASALVARADFVMLHSIYSFPVLAGYVLARIHRKPYGLWPHGSLAPVQRRIGRFHKRIYHPLIADAILGNASVLFYSAAGERDEARSLNLKAPSVVVPHGIDTTAFASLPSRGAFRRRFQIDSDAPLALYLGRLNAKKGIDLMLAAFQRCVAASPRSRLIIAGGPHPPSFEQRVRQWILERQLESTVIMAGHIDETLKLQALTDADCVVLLSEAENFGFALFEAMAAGLPVLVADTLNYASEIAEHGAGIIVSRDVTAAASGLLRLFASPEERLLMGERGRHLAGKYSWTRCGQHLEATIESVIAGLSFPADLQPQ